MTEFSKKKTNATAKTTAKPSSSSGTASSSSAAAAESATTTVFDDEASPLQPFVRARSVDVRFAPGSGFSEDERICVSIPGVGAELQSSVGRVKAVNDDGSVEFAPDDGAATTDR